MFKKGQESAFAGNSGRDGAHLMQLFDRGRNLRGVRVVTEDLVLVCGNRSFVELRGDARECIYANGGHVVELPEIGTIIGDDAVGDVPKLAGDFADVRSELLP